jgi:hypothetical protein
MSDEEFYDEIDDIEDELDDEYIESNIDDDEDDNSDKTSDDEEEIDNTLGLSSRLTPFVEQPRDNHIKTVYIDPNNRKTSNFLTKYEYTQIINIRSIEISNSNSHFADLTDQTVNNSSDIAKLELKQGRCPLKLTRELGIRGGIKYVELFDVNKMAFNG